MPQAKMIVLTKAVEGRQDEVDRWYDERHVADLLAVPGLIDSTRYDLRVMKAPAGSPAWDCLSVYTLEGDEIDTIVADMRSRMNTDRMPFTDALDRDQTLFVLGLPKDEAA